MSAGTTAERITRLEDHLKAQDAKLDLLIRLNEAQDEKFRSLSAKVENMAPTVELGQKAITTAAAASWFGKRLLWASAGIVGFLIYMQDRWHLVGQLFKRAG